ncbi:pyridoxal phosphate-dependent aminotransferase [Photobacterium sp. 2_MG-2023]|uniref:pyridoxal phosphate-dependent aminotransferase n=1 Tax=Photobacterium sp. 2_MG-2023 TaxID=3062663 RepID=UPI0026E13E1C|nr:pyridoxal phosphate-dependent aminotransferase [Photobacterium sp. 2_MG-2023]MDO6583659.1 pyridoxal phosphate-dependent aminotransferase [Photobacterium sp. 2_MG-2023]
MSIQLSNRIRTIQRSATYEILDKVCILKSQGKDILDFGGGEPNFSTPEHISKKAIDHIKCGDTHYTPSRGKKELLSAIAKKLFEENNIRVDPDKELIATPSAKHALFISLMATLDYGDEIIIPTPSWVSYQEMARLIGATPVSLPLQKSSKFTITSQALEEKYSDKTKAILINSPNNPLGKMLSETEIRDIVSFAIDKNIILIVDEIYEKVIYDNHQHFSIAAYPGAFERTITVNGFSKAYAMTGWRLGYVAGPELIISEILKIQQHTVGCAGSFIQQGGIEALTGNQAPITEMLAEYQTRRRLIVEGLNQIPGIECDYPDGALYVFPNIEGVRVGKSTEFAHWLLLTAGVAVTPGVAFGEGGEGYVRLSFATSRDAIEQALERIHRAVAAI